VRGNTARHEYRDQENMWHILVGSTMLQGVVYCVRGGVMSREGGGDKNRRSIYRGPVRQS
jgi:hypothetical protein